MPFLVFISVRQIGLTSSNPFSVISVETQAPSPPSPPYWCWDSSGQGMPKETFSVSAAGCVCERERHRDTHIHICIYTYTHIHIHTNIHLHAHHVTYRHTYTHIPYHSHEDMHIHTYIPHHTLTHSKVLIPQCSSSTLFPTTSHPSPLALHLLNPPKFHSWPHLPHRCSSPFPGSALWSLCPTHARNSSPYTPHPHFFPGPGNLWLGNAGDPEQVTAPPWATASSPEVKPAG